MFVCWFHAQISVYAYFSEWDPHVGASIWISPIDQWFKCFTECVWVYTLMHFEQQARKLPLRHADLITMNIAWWEHGAMRSYLKETPLYSPQLCISFTSLHSSRPSALPPKERAEWLILSHLSPGASWQPRVRVCVFCIGVQMSRVCFPSDSHAVGDKRPQHSGSGHFLAETLSLLYSYLLDVSSSFAGRRGNAMPAYVSMCESCVTVRVVPNCGCWVSAWALSGGSTVCAPCSP